MKHGRHLAILALLFAAGIAVGAGLGGRLPEPGQIAIVALCLTAVSALLLLRYRRQ